MKVDVLCSDPSHPVVAFLEDWKADSGVQDVAICFCVENLRGGNVLFLVSCSEIITAQTRARYREVMVLHASDLPKGRGWSPYIWELLSGVEEITMTLLRAEDPVDSGAIWAQKKVSIPKTLVFEEICARLFQAETDLMTQGLALIAEGATPTPQSDEAATFWPKRSPSDSQVDPEQSLADSFNQIRLADPNRYPAFFELHGQEYTIEVKKRQTES